MFVWTKICLFAIFVITCNSLCHNPCNYIENERYTNGEFIYEFGCKNTSELFVYDKNGDFFAKEICIQRSGPFVIFKWEPMEEYECYIDPNVDKRSRVVKSFTTGPRHYDSEPDICTACTGPFIEGTFVSDIKLLPDALRRPSPPMTCNRPSFCPKSDNTDDATCRGGEYRFMSNSESCCKDGKRRRRKSHKSYSRHYAYSYRG